MRRNVCLLAGSLVLATAALVGVALAPSPALVTLPLGLMFVAMMLSAMPASLLMKRIGRRAGFMLGAGTGTAGALLCAFGIGQGSFAAFGAGAALLGVFNGIGQFYRFTAAEVASEAWRSRAIALVMAGGVVAAFAGPGLASHTRDALAAAFAGSYLALAGVCAAGLVLLAGLRVPPPATDEISGEARPLREVVRQPVFLVAAFGAMSAYGVMNLLMTSTPLAMTGHGFDFPDTAWVIQWHVVGMYAPSFVTGHVVRRIGVLNVVLLGALMLLGCVVVNLLGAGLLDFWLALVLLGTGWNFMFIGSTTLLTECYRPAEKAKAQGLNDCLVFGTVALTATGSGPLHQALGWAPLNVGVLPVIAAALVAVAWLRGTRRSATVPA